jgi:hypothetical protein
VLSIERCERILKKHNCVIPRDDLIQIKQLFELWAQIQKIKDRLNKVYDFFFDGKLSEIERDEQVHRYKDSISNLETRIKALQVSEELNIKEKVNYGISIAENLGHYFTSASAETKIRLLGSIFNEEIEFDGEKYRTFLWRTWREL